MAGTKIADALVQLTVGDTRQFEADVQKHAAAAGDSAGQTMGAKLSARVRDVTAGLLGAGFAAATEAATTFEDELRTIQTVAPDLNLDKARNDILALSRETGKSVDDLSHGFYDLVSAGVSADDAIGVLSSSAKFATGALGSTAEAVDLVTSVMNSYKLSASDAGRITDVFAKAVADGKVTAAQLGGAISHIAPIASAAGVSMEEVAAGFAQLTKNGVAASDAATYMAQAINALLTPNTKLNEIQKQTGINFAQLAQQKGLSVALETLRKAVHGNQEEFASALGRLQAYNFALLTTGDNFGQFQDEIAATTHSSGLALEQYDIKSQSALEHGKRLIANIQSFLITVGAPFVQTLGPAVFALNQLGQAFGLPALGKLVGGGIGVVVGRISGGLAKAVKAAVGSSAVQGAQEAVSGWFQKLVTAGVLHVQIPAQSLINKLQIKALDAFSVLGDSAAGRFAKTFMAKAVAGGALIGSAFTTAMQVAQNLVSTVTSAFLSLPVVSSVKSAVIGAGAELGALQGTALGTALSAAAGAAVVVGVALIADNLKKPLDDLGHQIHDAIFGQHGPFDDVGNFLNSLPWPLGPKGAPDWAKIGSDAGTQVGAGIAAGIPNGLVEADSRDWGHTLITGNIGASLISATKEVGATVAKHIIGTIGGKIRDDKDIPREAHLWGLRTISAWAQGFEDGKQQVNDAWSNFLQVLKNQESPTKERAKLLGELTSKALQQGLHSQDPYVREVAEQTKQTIIDRLDKLKSSATNIGKTGMEYLRKAMKSKDKDIRDEAHAIYNAAIIGHGHDGPASLPARGKQYGSQFTENLAAGITEKQAIQDVKDASQSVARIVQKFLKISSPAEEGPWSEAGGPEGWGTRFTLSLAKGMKGSVGAVAAAGQALADAAVVGGPMGTMMGNYAPRAVVGGSGRGLTAAGSVGGITVGELHLHGIGSDVSPARAKRFGQQVLDEMALGVRQQGARIGIHPRVVP